MTTKESKDRRRLLYRVTTVAESGYVMFWLPAFFQAVTLELPGIAFGLAGFFVVILGLISFHDFQARPDHAPPTHPLAWRRSVALGLVLPAVLWLRLGEMPWIGWATLAGGPLVAWLDHSSRPASHGGPAEFSLAEMERTVARQPRTPVKRHPLDWLLVLWLFNLPLGVPLTWMLTSAIELTPENWRLWVGLRAAVCVVLPVICVLPGMFHLYPPRVLLTVAALLGITGLQVATGWSSARDWCLGPEWQQVEVARTYTLESGRFRKIEQERAELADGRVFPVPKSMRLEPGPARLLVLHGLGRLLDAKQP